MFSDTVKNAIFLYIIILCFIYLTKPAFIYDNSEKYKYFLPIIVIMIATFSYFIMM